MTDLIGTVWSCLDGVAEVSPSKAEQSLALCLLRRTDRMGYYRECPRNSSK
jgi:hypothetical protein